MVLQFMTTLEEGNGIKTVTPENVEALTRVLFTDAVKRLQSDRCFYE